TAQAPSLNALGIAVDFKALKRHLHTVIDPLVHEDLNLLFDETRGNPTAENIARYIFESLSPLISREEGIAEITRIDIWETPGNCASYFHA
ncbi:MAG: 6-carboxytetrahydropterin synthase, partial [Methylococcales bacterium]|nr:6-carboxytetrahydropterin synthase [Methylococcales bacterium]